MRGVARACVPVRSGRYRWRFGCGCQCHPSSVVEQCFRKAQVVGSSPMGGFLFATGGALRAAPVAAFQPPSASPVATRVPSADWIGRRNWSSRFVPARPGRLGSRVDSHGWLSLRNGRDPGLVAARHWLGGVRDLSGRLSSELVGMTHAPGCLGTAGAWGSCWE